MYRYERSTGCDIFGRQLRAPQLAPSAATWLTWRATLYEPVPFIVRRGAAWAFDRRKTMTTKLIIIVLAAAAFGWAFSELVEHSGQSGAVGDPGFACNDWAGNDWSTQVVR